MFMSMNKGLREDAEKEKGSNIHIWWPTAKGRSLKAGREPGGVWRSLYSQNECGLMKVCEVLCSLWYSCYVGFINTLFFH